MEKKKTHYEKHLHMTRLELYFFFAIFKVTSINKLFLNESIEILINFVLLIEHGSIFPLLFDMYFLLINTFLAKGRHFIKVALYRLNSRKNKVPKFSIIFFLNTPNKNMFSRPTLFVIHQ